MYILYECAAFFFAVMVGGTLLFAIAAACMMLVATGALALRKWPELSLGILRLLERWTVEPRSAGL